MRIKKPLKNTETIKKIGIYSWSILGLLIIISLSIYALYSIRIAIFPLVIAMGIAYLLSPLVIWLSKKMKRGFAILIAYIIFSSFFFALFFFMIPMVADQFRVFVLKLPVYINNLTGNLNTYISKSLIINNIEEMLGREILPFEPSIIYQYIANIISGGGSSFLQNVTSFTRSIVNVVITFIIGPVLGIYILKDSEKLRKVFTRVLPARFKNPANVIMDSINNIGGKYIRGQILVSIIVGFLCTLVLFLLKVDFAVLLGFIAGVLNLIPFLGPILGAIPAALVAFFVSPLKALLVILFFIGIQQLDNYVISPNVMKLQVGVHPAIVIFIILAVGAVLGPVGLILAVPTVAVIQAILKYYLLDKKRPRSP